MKVFASVGVIHDTSGLPPLKKFKVCFGLPQGLKNIRFIRFIRHLFEVNGTRILQMGPLRGSINECFGNESGSLEMMAK